MNTFSFTGFTVRIVKFLSKEIGGELDLFRKEKEFKAFTCHLIQAMEE